MKVVSLPDSTFKGLDPVDQTKEADRDFGFLVILSELFALTPTKIHFYYDFKNKKLSTKFMKNQKIILDRVKAMENKTPASISQAHSPFTTVQFFSAPGFLINRLLAPSSSARSAYSCYAVG
jgi:hypothetical protein